MAEHKIDTGTARPVRLPPYRLLQVYRSDVDQELQEMLAQKIIEPLTIEWAAAIVLVKKKDGILRLCVDYQRLNSASLTDAYPMPRIDDMIDQLGKAKFITTRLYLGLLPGACSQQRSSQDCIYHSLWPLLVHKDAIWSAGCPCNISADDRSVNPGAPRVRPCISG